MDKIWYFYLNSKMIYLANLEVAAYIIEINKIKLK